MKRLIGPLLVVAVFSALVVLPSQADAQAARCQGLRVTIDMATNGGNGTGTNGPDVILGTAGADTINGLGGDDTICAGGGADIVQGGLGNDVIYGENGHDKLFGAQGADTINGGNGDDTIHGNLGNDKLYGEGGADRIFGYADDDLIEGGDGDDRLHGNYGNDTISGGAGDDHIFGYGDNDTLNGGDGNDLIGGNFGNDVINGGPGNDHLYGSDGSDTVNGGAGNDIVHGNSGNDTVNGNSGNDTLDGGIGFDVCLGNGGVDTATRCETTTGVPATPTPTRALPTSTPVPPTATPISVPPPAAPTPVPAGPNATVAFQETFETPGSLNRFVWSVEFQMPYHGTPATWPGDHDLNCGPPTSTRTVHLPAPSTGVGGPVGDTVWWCREHVMTSMNHKGYAHLDFSPTQSFDQVSRVCWDQNFNDLGRKWIQVAVISEARFQANDQRLAYIDTQFGGGGPGTAMIEMAADDFMARVGGLSTRVITGQSVDSHPAQWPGETTDKRQRHQTCMTDLENGTIRFELTRDGVTTVRLMNGAMPEGPARVIFQDVTYNATKVNSGGPGPNTNVQDPFTWHWDNIVIATR